MQTAPAPPGLYDQLPELYRVEDRPYSLAEAEAYTRRISRGHYENFTVVSWALPRHLRRHMFNIYAYCRWSDDLGDELGSTTRALKGLAWWRQELDHCYAGQPRHPVFIALRSTIEEFQIPPEPFHWLLDAFVQDQTVTRFSTYDQLLDYCTRSADPVGRMVLHLFGCRDREQQRLSDRICTGLQLTNFWQDVARDWEKGRVYLPAEDLERFSVSAEEIAQGRATPAFASLLAFEVARTRDLFSEGRALLPMVPRRLRLDLDLFIRGGAAILDAIERQGYDVLSERPALSRRAKVTLMARRLLGL